jgi:hypothetical protein
LPTQESESFTDCGSSPTARLSSLYRVSLDRMILGLALYSLPDSPLARAEPKPDPPHTPLAATTTTHKPQPATQAPPPPPPPTTTSTCKCIDRDPHLPLLVPLLTSHPVCIETELVAEVFYHLSGIEGPEAEAVRVVDVFNKMVNLVFFTSNVDSSSPPLRFFRYSFSLAEGSDISSSSDIMQLQTISLCAGERNHSSREDSPSTDSSLRTCIEPPISTTFPIRRAFLSCCN